ncbi:MAG: sensor histidine kinase [Terriglobia bacterium]
MRTLESANPWSETPQAGQAKLSSRAYWLCQICGWSLYAIYVLASYIISTGLKRIPLEAVPLIFLLADVGGILLTHGLRRWMKVRGWPSLELRRLIPRLAGTVVALAVFMTAVVFVVEIPLLHLYTWKDYGGFVGAFFMVIGYASAFACWLIIYFNVHARRRRRALEIQTLQLQVSARDAQLRGLEAQLNPHFLFNCLNSLRGLIAEDPGRAQDMVTRLAELLRYSLRSHGMGTVALSEEMEAVKDYLDLEHIRFEDRLRVACQIEPQALSARIPPMLVETLVENAIKHGVAQLPEGGELRMSGGVRQGRLQIEVANSGRLRPADGNAGYGLRNSRERLRLLHGDQASLTLAQHGPDTVVASLSLPFSTATGGAVDAENGLASAERSAFRAAPAPAIENKR